MVIAAHSRNSTVETAGVTTSDAPLAAPLTLTETDEVDPTLDAEASVALTEKVPLANDNA
jgi:hypothetical protein